MVRTTTGMPALDAREDFVSARRAHLLRRLVRRPGARASLTLGAADHLPRGTIRHDVIPLREIVGTVDPTRAFDARFRPTTELVRERWQRIALAYRNGRSLPPITVLQAPEGYYVVDGRHRVSVALALGRRDIDAHVTAVHVPAAVAQRAACPRCLQPCPA